MAGTRTLILRWSWRDLRRRWGLVLAIALITSIGTGTYAGLGGTTPWRLKSNDASYALLGYHDLKVQLPEGGYRATGELIAMARAIDHPEGLAALAERLVVPTQVDASTPDRTVLVPGTIVGADPAPAGTQVDAVHVARGAGLDPVSSAGVLELKFADARGLPTSGTVRVSGGQSLTYRGLGYGPEYFSILGRPGQLATEANFAVLFLPLQAAQQAAGNPGRVNELVLRLTPGATGDLAGQEIRRAFAATSTIASGEDDPGHRALYADASNDEQTWNFLALLILFGASVAAFNLITRIVEAQRHELGVGMALGAPPRLLAVRPMLVGAQIAVVGVVAGIGVGLLAAAGMRSVFESALPLPVWLTPFPTARYAQAATIGLLLPVLATAIPVLRAVRVEPVDALRSGPRTASGARPGLAPLANRLPGRVITLMPIRNLLRSTRRTALTALGVAASITTLVAVLGVIDSVLGTFDRADAELSRASPDRLQVSLDRFYPTDSRVIEAIESSPAVTTVEPGVVVGSTVSANGVQIGVLAQVLDMDTAMWTPSVRGGHSAGRSGILLADKAASDLGVVPGDTVVLRHPRLDAEPPRVVETRIPVAGTHPSPLRFFAYLDRDYAAGLGLTGPANSVTVRPAPGTDLAGVQRALFSLPGVASVEPVASLADQFKETLDAITGVLRMVELFALALALLIALNSASIALEERAREQATMFAFGLRVRTVLRMLTVESVATGLLGTLIGVAGGLLAVRWLVNNLTTETVPDLGVPVLVSATSVMTTVGLGVLVVGLAPALTVRRLRRMDIPATLRVLE